ncbi:hypothetical protein TUA1478L_33260 [Lactiplantibacillus plantarum]
MLGPTGIGVLYGRENLLATMPPYQFGGEMIGFVHRDDSTWAELPWKFEAGTQNIAGAIGLGAAVDYLTQLGMDQVQQHEQQLVNYLLPKLIAMPGVTVYGPKIPNIIRASSPLISTVCTRTTRLPRWIWKVSPFARVITVHNP